MVSEVHGVKVHVVCLCMVSKVHGVRQCIVSEVHGVGLCMPSEVYGVMLCIVDQYMVCDMDQCGTVHDRDFTWGEGVGREARSNVVSRDSTTRTLPNTPATGDNPIPKGSVYRLTPPHLDIVNSSCGIFLSFS